jgi:hypothetical protein
MRTESLGFLNIRWGDTLQASLAGSPSMISPFDSLAAARTAITGEPQSLVASSTTPNTDNFDACKKDCHTRFPGLGDVFNHYLCVKHCETGSSEPPLTPEERSKVTTEQTDQGITGQIQAFISEAGKRIAFLLVALVILAAGLYAITRS